VRAEAAVRCPGAAPSSGRTAQRAYPALLKATEQSPFYQLAARRGPLASCSAAGASGELRLVYSFGTAGRLEVSVNPEFEMSTYTLALEQAGEEALLLLVRQEKAAFGAEGCGIDWKAAPAESAEPQEQGTQERIYRAPAGSNCAATVVTRDGKVVRVQLSHAG
jgi:hypothetical protein